MPKITFVEHDGTEHVVQVLSGYSVMQAAVDNMVSGILAECGGACSCATCHCYVDDEWRAKVGDPSPAEQDLIEFVVHQKASSRLSCQIEVTDQLDGLVVHLPKSQY